MAYLSTDVTRNDPVFGSRFIGKPADKKTFPDNEQNAYDVYQVVHDELYLDGNARQNLATFCQTFEEEELHWLMDLSIDKNMIDKDEYPQTAAIENYCVHMIADLWNAPDSSATIGTSKPACWAAWLPCGAGAQKEKRQANRSINPTWFADLSRSAG